VPTPERTQDLTHERDRIGASRAPRVTRSRTSSRSMRRATALALALSACAVAAPAAALGAPATTATPAAAVPSPFTADRTASIPTGLSPNSVATPLAFPDQAVILTWGDVAGATGYTVEVSDTPGFSNIVWKADVTQAIAVPETLLPDGQYWWRVKAVDGAGTVGAYSDVARFAKSWPNTVTGARVSATPGGPGVSVTSLNPYMSWNPVPGAASYDSQVAAGDQFATPAFSSTNFSVAFMSPSAAGALDDDGYSWRVRARDANGNPGPWTSGNPFTKAWTAPPVVSPADGAAGPDLRFEWQPVDGAEKYEVQVTTQVNTFTGSPLKIDATTAATSLTPTYQETRAQSLFHGDVWWRVRPIIDGVTGTWSPQRKFTWALPGATTASAQLSSSGDTDTGLMPHLRWTPVTGAALYRVDIASDSQFNHIVESEVTESDSWASRAPLADNQTGTGYWWRVVWGDGATLDNPQWMVDEAGVDSQMFSKQTRVTLGSPANGGVVTSPPLLTWSPVSGVARYEVQLSQDGKFGPDARDAVIWGTGATPGIMKDQEKRLPDGTWYWRVRAVDGSNSGQTWSPVAVFTLNSARPAQREPGDGDTVVYSPLMQWTPVGGAIGYDVQVGDTPDVVSAAGSDSGKALSTMQTAIVPPASAGTAGLHYWRVRANYGEGLTGQWSPTRSYRSTTPPTFGLNSVPKTVDYRSQVILAGQLKNNGAGAPRQRLYLERRLWPSADFRPAGSITTGTGGRYRFSLQMVRSADYRLMWREADSHPAGQANFAIKVRPRITFRLAARSVQRKKGLLVKGSIYPRRPAVIQMRTADGWRTLRKVTPRRARFSIAIATARLDPGRHNLRLYVPRDAQRKFANTASPQRRVLVFDRFVVR
jgi:hypothetical protein